MGGRDSIRSADTPDRRDADSIAGLNGSPHAQANGLESTFERSFSLLCKPGCRRGRCARNIRCRTFHGAGRAVTGPLFHYSDTWQLVINTVSNVVTFLMVFLIQNTQNRDAAAMQLKLNELIRAMSTARNTMVDLENCTEEEIAAMREEFASIRARIAA
jgi:hypothetical protein